MSTGWRNFSNTNLSYFANMTAGWFLSADIPLIGGNRVTSWEGKRAYDKLLNGDRHITGGSLSNHMLTLVATSPAGWLPAIHGGSGNIGFLGGEVRSMTTNQLRKESQIKRDYAVRLAIP